MKTLEDGICLITGHEIKAEGSQDEQRMADCPFRSVRIMDKGKRVIIEISGADINELDPDAVAEAVYGILNDDGYDVTVAWSITVVGSFQDD